MDEEQREEPDLWPMLMAPAVGYCNGCYRKTWTETEFGTLCNMRQPDGLRCEGTFASFR